MKKIKNIALIGLLSVFMASCSITYPYTAANNSIGGKKGVSETVILFGAAGYGNLGVGLVLNKDYGVIDAVKNGGINKVATVDIKVTNYVFFQKAKIIVHGE